MFSTVGDTINKLEDVQNCGKKPSVLWVNTLSSMENIQFCEGKPQALWVIYPQHCTGDFPPHSIEHPPQYCTDVSQADESMATCEPGSFTVNLA